VRTVGQFMRTVPLGDNSGRAAQRCADVKLESKEGLVVQGAGGSRVIGNTRANAVPIDFRLFCHESRPRRVRMGEGGHHGR
jgi:hypothetical protein